MEGHTGKGRTQTAGMATRAEWGRREGKLSGDGGVDESRGGESLVKPLLADGWGPGGRRAESAGSKGSREEGDRGAASNRSSSGNGEDGKKLRGV